MKKSEENILLDKKILKSLLEIPNWKVTTYKILAEKFWVHPRRIASVMKCNKEPEIYPCYKVVSHSREISWYSALEWVSTKIEKLKNDWIIITKRKVSIESIYMFEK